MNTTLITKKSLPLSLTLGIAPLLDDIVSLEDYFLNKFSLDDQKTFLFTASNLTLVCPSSKAVYPNPSIISLAVRRVLALKKHTRFPVLIVVKGKQEGEQVAIELARLAPYCKLYNMIYGLRHKITKEFLTKFHSEADFVLLNYHKLREVVMKKICPATEQIVFVNPLTKSRCLQEIIFLDDIVHGLHRHKCRKPSFSYVLDNALFGNISREEFKFLLNTDDCLFYQCEEQKRSFYENKLNGKVPFVLDVHMQFFILRELFRGRKSKADFMVQFKKTITYKLHLFSNNIYPDYLSDESNPQFKDTKIKLTTIDKQLYLQLNRLLNLFSKKTSKTMEGKFKQLEPSFDEEPKLIWEEPVETAPFLPLIEKKSDSKYYLTGLGAALLVSITNYPGIETSLPDFLVSLSNTLYQKKIPSVKFSIEEILQFYRILIGDTSRELPAIIKNLLEDSEKTSAELCNEFDQIIQKEFGYLLDSYTSVASIQLLGAFEDYMDTKALLFFQRLKEYRRVKKQSWEEKRKQAILNNAKYELLSTNLVSKKYGIDKRQAESELELLVKGDSLECTKITDCHGKIKIKYGTPELLVQKPHLKKNCGGCLFHQKRFNSCPLLHLVHVFNPSSFPSGYEDYIRFPINDLATACEEIVEQEELIINEQEIRFSVNYEILTQKMKKLSVDFLLAETNKISYRCISCQEELLEFGSGESLYFPHKRIICPNCATGYFKKNDETVIVQLDHRHILRMKYYAIAGSIPPILMEKNPTASFVIYDNEPVDITIEEGNKISLIINDQTIPLEKVQYLFFAGQDYQELEEFLRKLSKFEPEKYQFTIGRASTQIKEDKQEEQSEIRDFSSTQYQVLHSFITYLSKTNLINSSFLKARHLSNIGGILYLKKLADQNHFSDKISKFLYEMIDLFMKVNCGIESSFFGMLLEAQSNKYFFELLKVIGKLVGLWTRGRVSSRLVKKLFLSYKRNRSYAYSPFDTILNQLMRTFRSKIEEVFHQIGLDPKFLGQGLFHRRKTKSDIDKLGLFFDLIEPVRVLVLVTMYEAMMDQKLTNEDYSFVLGEHGEEIYHIKNSSQEKIKQLVDSALEKPVYYLGKEVSFIEAFKLYLESFRRVLLKSFDYNIKYDKVSPEQIIQIFNEEKFQPFVFCPIGIQKELGLVNKFAGKYSDLFKEEEKRVLDEKQARLNFRSYAKQKWWLDNRRKGQKKLQLTKYQAIQQERSLAVILFFVNSGMRMDLFFGSYSTAQIRDIMNLTQNQTQRILKDMTDNGLLLKEKRKDSCYYQLNLENKANQELLYTLCLIPYNNHKQEQNLLSNSNNLLKRITNHLSLFMRETDGYQSKKAILWNKWTPSTYYITIQNWLEKQVAKCEIFFERRISNGFT
ncbi:MAG: hypothetical protein JXA54_13810 [Candidatus Heimdallarchaeota archaeon]|nr:hypothetical protein [Candidatus Heimdallarchaeota archaeon]